VQIKRYFKLFVIINIVIDIIIFTIFFLNFYIVQFSLPNIFSDTKSIQNKPI